MTRKWGFFCNLCSVSYLNENTTEDQHCRSQTHCENLQVLTNKISKTTRIHLQVVLLTCVPVSEVREETPTAPTEAPAHQDVDTKLSETSLIGLFPPEQKWRRMFGNDALFHDRTQRFYVFYWRHLVFNYFFLNVWKFAPSTW